MLDIALLRKQASSLEKKLQGKNPEIALAPILSLDQKHKKAVTELESLKAQQNKASKIIGIKKRNKEDATPILEEMKVLRDQIVLWQQKVRSLRTRLQDALDALPNIPDDTVPISTDLKKNICLKTVGEKPQFSFPIKNHLELGASLELFDFKASAKLTGSNWPLYKGLGAQLERAFINYMLDIHHKNGFTEIIPPLLVNEKTMYAAGQLPKFRQQLFSLNDPDFPFHLIPTAEVPLHGIHQDQILEDLPKLYTAYTPCFRREAGALGKQERGLIRMHQFHKVELFCICKPEQSALFLEKMLASAEEVLQRLGLHYRNILLVSYDLAFSAAKTIDIEVFLPAQGKYREVSSVSLCTDFQARRGKMRFASADGLQYPHTLNGSGVATSRLMVAFLETYQNADGSITIPEVLRPYLPMSFIDHPKISLCKNP